MTCPAGFTLASRGRSPYAYMAEHLRKGQRISFYNTPITWSEHHVRPRELEQHRMRGDPLADAALEALGVKPGQDAFDVLMEYVQRPVDQQESDAPRKFLEQLLSVPDWADDEKLRRGQHVYWKYVMYIMIGLVHYSLSAGFNAQDFTKVLTSTGYLAGKGSNARITETGQFVLDVMSSVDNLTPGTGTAWKSIVQVRILHAQVRLRLSRLSKHHPKVYNIDEHGVPINQEDMAVTLYAMSTGIWRYMEYRLGVIMPLQDREDFLHVWRTIGYYMGVDPEWDPASNAVASTAMCESILMHIVEPNEQAGKLTAGLLETLSSIRLPIFLRWLPNMYPIHMAISERLVGPDLWMLMGLEQPSWIIRILINVFFTWLYVDLITVSQLAWWCNMRSYIFSWIGEWLIQSELGKRSNFTYKKQVDLQRTETEAKRAADKVSAIRDGRRSTWSSSTDWVAQQPLRMVIGILSIALVVGASCLCTMLP